MVIAVRPFEVPRAILPHVLTARGLLGVGVEVGVCKGEFSEHILQHWLGTKLYLVDSWCEYHETYDHEANYQETLHRTENFADRVGIMRMSSLEAAREFENESLDWVYLDADHRYEAVWADLNAWFPKIKPGGLFAGDDYGPGPITEVNFGTGPLFFGVRRAVDEFSYKVHRNISIDWESQWGAEDWTARNWYFLK